LTAKDELDAVNADDLLQRIKAGEVTVIDVRPELEYQAGHLPGAINVPLKKLVTRLQELSSATEIVAYCRGPYCALAFEAVEQLRKQGYKASRLEYGLPEWRLSGYPIESSAKPSS
jgi:rhodanese-related sulfurtransferase